VKSRLVKILRQKFGMIKRLLIEHGRIRENAAAIGKIALAAFFSGC
jgi:hypothetical protein